MHAIHNRWLMMPTGQLLVKGNPKLSVPQHMHAVKAMGYLVDAESAMRGIAPICI
jgi:hypothetical protein